MLERWLAPPRYGWEQDDGTLYRPTTLEILREFGYRLNVFRSVKNWLSAFTWFSLALLLVPCVVFFFRYFSMKLLAAAFVYGMIVLGTHGTFYLHRFATHRAFRFKNAFVLFICKNLVVKVVAEELYVVSHHVHHRKCEEPGDPYNVHGGWLYCFLADVNHQPIARDLTAPEHERVTRLLSHCGMRLNSYAQYQKWGSLARPAATIASYALNWAFWYATFWALGGHALATALFGAAFVWAVGVRTYNFAGHGAGKDRRQDGQDFNRRDWSVNQLWPGIVAGEWHNNHHLYPNGARSGFLPHQLDLAWVFIRTVHALGGISSYRDYKAEFLREHYHPYLRSRGEVPRTRSSVATKESSRGERAERESIGT